MMEMIQAALFGYASSLLATGTGMAWIPYACVVLVLLKAIWEPPLTRRSVWWGLSLGFFFDIFSGHPRGLWTAGIVALVVSAKYITQSYVRLPNA